MELTYPLPAGTFQDDFPFLKGGICYMLVPRRVRVFFSFVSSMFLILYPECCEEPIPNFDQHQIFLSLKKAPTSYQIVYWLVVSKCFKHFLFSPLPGEMIQLD